MSEIIEPEDVALTITIRNTKPVELIDLGKSLQALGQQYEQFVHSHGYESQAGNARLYVSELETGSIIAKLQALLQQGSFVLDHIQVFAGFVGNLTDIINYFRTQSEKPPENISHDEATRLSQILEPVAKDGGASISINVTGNTAAVTVNTIVVTSESANAIQNNVRRFLGPPIPEHGRFEREVLYLQQVRGEVSSSVGDRGVIEAFSKRAVRLNFMTPAAKGAILDAPENPFKMAYVVDGQVSTVRGEPALYKISTVHETLERP